MSGGADSHSSERSGTGVQASGRSAPGQMALAGRQTWRLDDRDHALEVIDGSVDVFALGSTEGRSSGPPQLLFRARPGSIILGAPPWLGRSADHRSADKVELVAVGLPGAKARMVARASVSNRSTLEGWVLKLSTALAEQSPDLDVQQAEIGSTYVLADRERLGAPALGVAWISVQEGTIRPFGTGAACDASHPLLPLAAAKWIEACGSARVVAHAGADLELPQLWDAIDRFHHDAMGRIAERMAAAADAEMRQRAHRTVLDAAYAHEAITDLAAVIVPRPDRPPHLIEPADPLLGACRIAAAASGAEIVRPPGRETTRQHFDDVVEIARASRLRVRRTMLRADWWRRDGGPLVTWHGDARRPVAIVPARGRGWIMVDPASGTRRQIDRRLAAELATDAAVFYLPLPARPLSFLDLLAFWIPRARSDAVRVLLGALALAALSLTVPLVTEVLFNSVLPRGEFHQLMFCVGALIAAAIGATCFQALQGIAFLRIESALDWTLQAAILDRLLRLPVSFFRRYTAGDLTDRALGIETVRALISGHTIYGLMAGLFALSGFALMAYYDVRLALIAIALTVLHAAIVIMIGAVRLRHERRHSDEHGKVEGIVLQFVSGVAKLRVAAATVRAFAVWARLFGREKRHFVASQRAANVLEVFEAAFPTAATLIIFAAAAYPAGKLALDTGEFLAFYVAFGQSLAGMGQWATAVGEAILAVPHLSRIQPLLSEPPEVAGDRKPAIELSGAIELDQVTFHYQPGSPAALSKVTLRVGRGEYVAIVGPSGSGKSTIFRLLLGFEKPDSGAVLYDGRAIDTLDIGAVRRQIGTVLQNGRFASGSLYENISGGAPLSLAQAWEAARLAGLAADIAAWPMDIHTVVTEGVSSLSGGQRQRLMIARALAHRPRIVLLDEAMSAIDNDTQAVIHASLAELQVTRIVITHWLASIRHADRIVVLAGGEVVQTGTFNELIAVPGTFAELAKRQLL